MYDTKFIAEALMRERASFLSFSFYRRLVVGCVVGWVATGPHPLAAAACSMRANCVHVVPDVLPTHRTTTASDAAAVCESFAVRAALVCYVGLHLTCLQLQFHGHCRDGHTCQLSHDMDNIVDFVQAGPRGRAKRKRAPDAAPAVPSKPRLSDDAPASDDGVDEAANGTDKHGDASTTGTETQGDNQATGQLTAHSAVYDALATGYSFASFHELHEQRQRQSKSGGHSTPASSSDDTKTGLLWEDAVNRLFIGGHDYPLILRYPTSFTRSSHTYTRK